MSSGRGIRLLALIAIATGVVLTAWGWWQLVQLKDGATGPRQLIWRGPDGGALNEAATKLCRGEDDFAALVVGDVVWTSCPVPPLPADAAGAAFAGGLARLVPAQGEAKSVWPAPPELPLRSILAVRPHPIRPWLGVVYGGTVDSGLGVAGAIAGPEGWLVPPARLPGRSSDVLGVAWVGERFEIGLGSTLEAADADRVRDPVIVSLAANSAAATRDVPLTPLCHCPNPRFCDPQAAVRTAEGPWRFIVACAAGGGGWTTWRVAEDGSGAALERGDRVLRHDLDATAAGLLEMPLERDGQAVFRLTPEGHVEPRAPTVLANGVALDRAQIVAAEGTLQRVTRVCTYGDTLDGRSFGHRGGQGALFDRLGPAVDDRPRDDRVLSSWSATGSDVTALHVVARTAGAGTLLSRGALVPRAKGGSWLVALDGTYVVLTDDLRRADPLGIVEHLRRGGSFEAAPGAPTFVVLLAWVLFGLPVTLLAAAVVMGFRRRSGPRPAIYLLVAAALYVLPAAGFVAALTGVLK